MPVCGFCDHHRCRFITDTGSGVPESEREKFFQRLYRLETCRTTTGSGLGLSLVSAIADLHGICISLSDIHPGLRVTLEFPLPNSQSYNKSLTLPIRNM
ncbi:MAG: ATP-binding protein [Nitrospirales bacterium]|nr:ATP-binding protein [Nitrospirales bacterium]